MRFTLLRTLVVTVEASLLFLVPQVFLTSSVKLVLLLKHMKRPILSIGTDVTRPECFPSLYECHHKIEPRKYAKPHKADNKNINYLSILTL